MLRALYRRYVESVIRHPWPYILVTWATSLLLGYQATGLTTNSDIDAFVPQGDDAMQNLNKLKEVFGTNQFAMIAILRADHPDGVYNPETLALVHELTEWLETRPEFETSSSADLRTLASAKDILSDADGILSVDPFLGEPLASTREEALAIREAVTRNGIYVGTLAAFDGKGALIIVEPSEAGLKNRVAMFDLLDAKVKAYEAAGRPEVFHLGGRSIVESLFHRYIPKEVERIMPRVVVIIAILLFTAFGSLRGVLIPLNVVLFNILWVGGMMVLLDKPAYTTSSIMPPLLIAIAVADAIHLIARYYDAQKDSPEADRETVVRATMIDMGMPVGLTSATTIIGFLSMTQSALTPIFDFGILMALGILSAFFLTLLYVPACLMVCRLQRRKAGTRKSRPLLTRALRRTAITANKNPRAILVTTIAIVLAGIFWMSRATIDSSQVAQFPPSHSLRQADNAINRHFAGGTVLDIMIDGREDGAIREPELLRKIDRLQNELAAVDFVGDTLSIAELIKRLNQAMTDGSEAARSIPDSRALVAQYLEFYMTGGAPGDFDNLKDYGDRYAHLQVYLNDPGTAASAHVVAETRKILARLFPNGEPGAGGPVEYRLAGSAYGTMKLEGHIKDGQIRSLLLCTPVLILFNWLAFGSPLMGFLTVLPVILAIILVYGGMSFLGVPADIATIMLGGMSLGVGVDFAIHYLHKYRALRERGITHAEATVETAVRVGRALYYNAMVLFGGFIVLLGARFYPQQKLGGLVAATMVICCIATLYLFPVLLGIGDRREQK